ncbi:apyrase [Ctenocephalides felis]|uniref:apyrase n=1 Tax=Ctenocephalides felis TaxID=7515 RepID=UPI000E6E52DD|nr:apyrase [Ctenocephalides felis]
MNLEKLFVVILCLCLVESSICATVISKDDQDLYELSIIHLNDFHARFEEITPQSTACNNKEECIGGIARVYTEVKRLQNERTNPIFLNAGDNFQGTLWYNIHRWNVTQYFLNKFKTDAVTLGNHEFDHKIEGVVPFMGSIEAPIVVCNIDDSQEPTFQGKYKKSIVLERHGRKIGVIGVILATTNEIAATGKLSFLDEPSSVAREAERLVRDEGVNIVIVLSHCGLDVDKRIAAEGGPNIDIIVGGHSHTFMFTGPNPPGPDKPLDDYPAVVENNGHKVLIVQASAFTKYLGDIVVWFDADGHVQKWKGEPIYVKNSIVPDPTILDELKPWAESVHEAGSELLGVTRVPLKRDICGIGECNIGSFVTDAYVHGVLVSDDFPAENGTWTYAAISFINAGGIRADIPAGNITYNDLVTAQPFENTLDTMELQGKHLMEAIEHAVSVSWSDKEFVARHMLQVSGLRVVYNITLPVGQRTLSLEALCRRCRVPKFKPVQEDEWYRMVVPSFIGNGGDGFTMISKNRRRLRVGELDQDALKRYIRHQTPITQGLDGRIIMYRS